MLRLAIVDDERTIREALHTAIDWESLGFTVIGLYKNGAEAYDAILDEYPDVVLTDLRMPGLSGLELIARVCTAKLDTEFIILSGYGEFELAQQAMRWGVKHYLLKPSSPEQIREVALSVKEDCYRKRIVSALEDHHHEMALQMRQSIIRSMLTEALAGTLSIDEMLEKRKPFIDVENTNYEVYYIHQLEKSHLAECLTEIRSFHDRHANGIALHAVYVRSALIVFFESYSTDYTALNSLLNSISVPSMPLTIEHHSYENLRAMMPALAARLNRFDTITLLDGSQHITLQNQTGLTKSIDTLIHKLTTDRDVDSACHELGEIMNRTSDLNLIKMLLTVSLIKHTVQKSNAGQPLISVASLLMEIRDSNSQTELIHALKHQFNSYDYSSQPEESSDIDLVKRVKAYVTNNLDNEELSLKWLAENQFYMNVDYLSKQFAKKSGEKFSAYLTRKRIERAKVLLQSGESINRIAEQVGCGNNPQYFGQLFKRIVGMTPSEYAKKAE